MQRDRFDIMVKSKSTQDQIASYLVKVVLGLRDKENVEQSVRLLGSGTAISHVILVAEIIRARIKNVCSIVQFEDMEREDTQNQRTYHIPAIRIKLTTKPSEEELQQPGYQAPNDVPDDKHVELFDYVMLYAKNLYFWSGGRNNQRNDNRRNDYNNDRRNDNRRDDNRNDNRRDDNRRDDNRREDSQKRDNPRRGGNQYPRQRQNDPDNSDNWNKDRTEFQNKQFHTDGVMRQRGNNRGRRPNDRERESQQQEQQQPEERQPQQVFRGEYKTRGGQRRGS